VFGPVLAVIAHDGDDDAVRIANNSRYGLSGAVFATDRDRALAAARRVQSGQISVNGAQPFFVGPFGGYKQSGVGREGGVWGFEEYLQVKVIGV
jgi:aldehyde dehydrogenase (NAD+)